MSLHFVDGVEPLGTETTRIHREKHFHGFGNHQVCGRSAISLNWRTIRVRVNHDMLSLTLYQCRNASKQRHTIADRFAHRLLVFRSQTSSKKTKCGRSSTLWSGIKVDWRQFEWKCLIKWITVYLCLPLAHNTNDVSSRQTSPITPLTSTSAAKTKCSSVAQHEPDNQSSQLG